jgi:PAS domain S-box-containing protein
MVSLLPVMLVQTDRDMRVTYMNPATQATTGYEMHEIADPAAWAAAIHPEDLSGMQAIVTAALAGQPGRTEIRYRAKGGDEKVAYAMCEPTWQGGTVVGTTTLLVDLTRERQLERELLRAQRLELIGRLSSGVAHDFNNLLQVVLNLADLARGSLPADHPVTVDLRRITEAGEQAACLASQLLTFSKQRTPTARRIEVNRVVRRTLELLRATLPAAVRLEPDLAGEELHVSADETQLQQVLMNLCLNARDAMPQGGRLRVRTRRALAEGPSPWVRLSVEDTGRGMSEQVRTRIFEPFFSTREGGTGLGLAVVQQIAESYGARVEVHSQPGQGSRFEVWWPLV